MNPEQVIEIGTRALSTVLLVAAPVLAVGLSVGLMASLFQAVTQINEVTLAFIPKIVAMMLAILLFSGWMLDHVMVFARDMLESISRVNGG